MCRSIRWPCPRPERTIASEREQNEEVAITKSKLLTKMFVKMSVDVREDVLEDVLEDVRECP